MNRCIWCNEPAIGDEFCTDCAPHKNQIRSIIDRAARNKLVGLVPTKTATSKGRRRR